MEMDKVIWLDEEKTIYLYISGHDIRIFKKGGFQSLEINTYHSNTHNKIIYTITTRYPNNSFVDTNHK
jgi:hypothetical protein